LSELAGETTPPELPASAPGTRTHTQREHTGMDEHGHDVCCKAAAFS